MMKNWLDSRGVFETCRVQRGRVVHLKEHLNRLRASLKTLGMKDWDERKIRGQLDSAARGIQAGYVRIAVFGQPPKVLIHRQQQLPYRGKEVQQGVSIRTVPSRWPASESGWAQVKSSERLGSVLARIESGTDVETLRMNRQGYLTEGTVSNLFLIREGILMTPPGWLGVLEGVTRQHVLSAARRLRIPVQIRPVTRHDLFNAQEAFLTNVLMGLLPIRQVDGRTIGKGAPGRLTRRLRKAVLGGWGED